MSTDQTLDQEILKVMAEKLPHIHVQHLTNELNSLRVLRQDNKKLTDDLEATLRVLKLRTQERDDAVTENQQHHQISLRLTVIQEKERNLEVTILKDQLKSAVERASIIEKLADTVFRNKHITYSAYGNLPVKDNSGYHSSQPFNSTTTVHESGNE